MRLVEHFFRIIAPANCLSCGAEGSPVCAWCTESALPEVAGRCYRCNKLTKNSATCLPCKRSTPIRHLWIRTEYTAVARVLVHAMKFKYSLEAAELIAHELVNTLPALPPQTVVVYVPAATSHVRQRGFDHAKIIAQELARELGLAYAPALARTGQARQVGATRRQRLAQMEGVFRVRQPYLVNSLPVLLVDDVLTTGATIESATRVLKTAGAKSVDAVVFAGAK